MAEAKAPKKKEEKKVKEPVTEVTWEKSDGKKIRTNAEDATIDYALELGWKRIDEE